MSDKIINQNKTESSTFQDKMHPDTQTHKKKPTRNQFKVFLGGTPFNCTSQEIRQYFIQYGEIKKVYFPMDKRKKR